MTWRGLATTLHAIMTRVVTLEYSAIYFFDPETGQLRLYDTYGFDPEERREAERTALDRHPGQRAAHRGADSRSRCASRHAAADRGQRA